MKNFIYKLNLVPAVAVVGFIGYNLTKNGLPELSDSAPMLAVAVFALVGSFAVTTLNPRQ